MRMIEIPAGVKRMKAMIKPEKGVTLIELVVAMGISGILLAAIYAMFVTQNRSKVNSDQVSEMQQNLRVASDMIERDIRNTGYGLANVLPTDLVPLVVTNSTTGPDSLTIRGNFDDITTYAPGVIGVASPGTIVVDDATGFQKYDYIVIADAQNPAHTEAAQIIAVPSGNNLTVDGVVNAHPANCLIHDIRQKSFSVNGNHELILALQDPANINGTISHLVAENVEDLQFGYGLDNDFNGYRDSWTENPSAVTNVASIEINLLVRTPKEDSHWVSGLRPTLRDHPGAFVGTNDGYRRRILRKEITVRNQALTRM